MMMTKIKLLVGLLILSPFFIVAQSINQIDGNGLKQGKWTKTYANGVTRYKGQFKKDMPYGEFRNYYMSGVLKAVTNYSADGIIANTKTYHENSQPLAEGKYINQLKDSIWNYFSDVNGELISMETYKNGKLNGQSLTFYPESGKVTESIKFKNDLKEGDFRKYFPDGSIMTEGKYKNDQLEGDFILYFPNGKIQLKGKYKNGRQIGNWSYFDEKGNELNEEDFRKSME